MLWMCHGPGVQVNEAKSQLAVALVLGDRGSPAVRSDQAVRRPGEVVRLRSRAGGQHVPGVSRAGDDLVPAVPESQVAGENQPGGRADRDDHAGKRPVPARSGGQAGLDWGGDGPPIVIVHATGFLNYVYRPIAMALRSIGRVYGYDQRGHGASEVPPVDELNWFRTADDLETFLTAQGFSGVRAFGHSAGATAIAAVAPVIGADADDIASSISFTAVLGVLMVLGLPLLIPLLKLSATQYGILAGLTVYAVPQVLAATVPAGVVSTQIGTLVKLVRVLMLGPVVVSLSLFASKRRAGEASKTGAKKIGPFKLVPWFIIGFLLLAGLRSLQLIPDAATAPVTRTAALLTKTMGFCLLAQEQNRFRYEPTHADAGGPGRVIDVVCAPAAAEGRVAVGTIHHIAFRTPGDAQQHEWLTEVADLGYNISPVMDRIYFHSIYYREPGGILFEIATDSPGFAIDEPVEQLGEALKLPPWLEAQRPRIEAALPPIHLHEKAAP